MSFSNMLEILQEKNKGKIVLIKLGTFYIATGRDALLLHTKLNLKCTCFKNNICKVGVPVILIPKINEYIEYMLNILIKLPRTEKFNIGNEYKVSMYKILSNVLYINKINREKHIEQALEKLNIIDVELNCQRIYLRIMYKQKWIDSKKFDISIGKIYEIGNIVGGLVKYYAKNNKK